MHTRTHALPQIHYTKHTAPLSLSLSFFSLSLFSLSLFLPLSLSLFLSLSLSLFFPLSSLSGYISRSVAGSYDNEGVAIFALLFTYYLWVCAVKTGSVSWAALTALSYFYMVSAWGGYVFIINLIPLHVLTLLVCGRYSSRLYTAYCTFYALGTVLSMQVSFVGFQPVYSAEHMAALGVFGLLQLVAVLEYAREQVGTEGAAMLTKYAVGAFLCVLGGFALVGLGSGYLSGWTGRFYSLMDPTYAKAHIPIIASVSEHQPTAWSSFFFDLHLLCFWFPAGLYFMFRRLTDHSIFVLLYAITTMYFAGVMVRLMLVLAPVVCVVSAVAVSHILDTHCVLVRKHVALELEQEQHQQQAKQRSAAAAATATTKKKKNHKKKGSLSSSTSSLKSTNTFASLGYGSASSASSSTAAERKASKGAAAAAGEFSKEREVATVVVLGTLLLLVFFSFHCTWVTSHAYSSPSIVLAAKTHAGLRVFDDFRESYYWLRQNTAPSAKVMSWWDYGYQLANMANRTTLVDNNTWNNTHIAQVGKAFASDEQEAHRILSALHVDYVLVYFGGVAGYSSDDINKFLWMVRIAGSVDPRVQERDYISRRGELDVGPNGTPTMLNSLMYKLSYYGFGQIYTEQGQPPG
jgi:dolichyl-diphosphooligosaccharide---protein glycosyltransferase